MNDTGANPKKDVVEVEELIEKMEENEEPPTQKEDDHHVEKLHENIKGDHLEYFFNHFYVDVGDERRTEV